MLNKVAIIIIILCHVSFHFKGYHNIAKTKFIIFFSNVFQVLCLRDASIIGKTIAPELKTLQPALISSYLFIQTPDV